MVTKQLEDKALFNKVIKRVRLTNHQEDTVTLATMTPVISQTTSEDKTVLEATTEEEVREDEGSEVAEEEVMTEVVEETVTEVEEEDITMIEEVTAETMTDREGLVDMVHSLKCVFRLLLDCMLYLICSYQLQKQSIIEIPST